MAESSLFWITNGTGDGTDTGYTQTQVFEWLRSLFITAATNLGGVSPDYQNKLAVSGTSSPVSVAAGAALVYGIPYVNSAAVDVAIPTPSGATRIDRIVLRANYTAQTVRITRVAGSEGGAAPSLTQSAGTTWDIPLAQASITTAGVITVTDEREWLSLVGDGAVTTAKIGSLAVTNAKLAVDSVTATKIAAAQVNNSKIADGAVTEAKLGTGAVTTAKIANDAVVRDHIADFAVGADQIDAGAVGASELATGAVTEAKIGTGAVATAKIADNAVDDTKVGDRVPQLYRRQGGSASHWAVVGTTTYTPGAVRMQAGSITATIASGTSSEDVAITYPVAFSYNPLVFVSMTYDASNYRIVARGENTTTLGFTVHAMTPGGGNVSGDTSVVVAWLAIGPE